MNLLVDESVDQQIVDRLRQNGHTIVYVAEEAPGIVDDDVLRRANERAAPLVTADKDFGELVFRQRRANKGVVLLRLAGLTSGRKASIVSCALRDHGNEMLQAFSVISPGTVRIRKAQ
jgi:predicted nuclease of predicted toxin-antitoxin system